MYGSSQGARATAGKCERGRPQGSASECELLPGRPVFDVGLVRRSVLCRRGRSMISDVASVPRCGFCSGEAK